MTITVRPEYGWRGNGKSAAEIAGDLDHTRYRLDADIRALKAKLSGPTRLAPLAPIVAALVATVLTYVIRRIRRRRLR